MVFLLSSGLGGTLFDPPRSALVVKLIRPEQRGRFFSLLMMQDSAGAVIGALLGSWLLQYDFHFGLRDGRYFVHIMRPFQCMAASGTEAISSRNAGA